MRDVIFIQTFGEFNIQYKDQSLSAQDNRAKKVWTLIEYVITSKQKEISTDAIINLLWPEESISESPMNAFKVCLYRARKILSKLFSDEKVLITKGNTISWNPTIPYELDCDIFETLCKKADSCPTYSKEKAELYEQALSLYHGDFLHKSSNDDWIVPISTYYHNLYITAAQNYLELLYNQKDYDQLILNAYQAARIEEYNENIQYYLIYGLYYSGKSQAAISQYNYILNLLYNDFGINPTEKLRTLYLDIITKENTTQTDLNLIQQKLKEKVAQPHAYECDYAIFQHLYQIQSRSMERTGLNFFLCLFTLDSIKKTAKSTPIAYFMNRLSNIISNSLRTGDVFSRYSPTQYIVLLPSPSYENATIVGERILRNFDQSRPKLNCKISYRLRCMEP